MSARSSISRRGSASARYLGHLSGELIFTRPVTAIHDADLKAWLIEWDRSLKTKATYHGLMHGVFAYAVKRGYLTANPAVGTAPKLSRVKASRPELRFLTEKEAARAVALAGSHGDLISVTLGTGLRFGEVSALWVSDVDLERGTVRVNKAWKRNGEDDSTEIPGWLARQLKAKHTMRDHHLGTPKTTKSRRTIGVSPALLQILEERVAGRAPGRLRLHLGERDAPSQRRLLRPGLARLMKELAAEGIAPFRFHDLRHTHVAWLVAGGVPLPNIQARLGHESITTTIDTYGHLLPAGDELISSIIDLGLTGGTIRPKTGA